MKQVGLLFVVGLSTMVGVREPMVTAQSGGAPPTVSIRRNPVFVGPVWSGDFNGDGITDLAGSTHDPESPFSPAVVTVALGVGDGTFGPPLRSLYMGTVFDVGDFNNDGKLDVLAERVDVDEDLIAIAGKGDGTFGAAGTVATTFRLHVARSADLDGDGNRDVIIVETAEASGGDTEIILIIRGRGDLTFDRFAGTVVPASPGARDATVTDLNVDGLKDIVVANHSGQSLTVLLNQGSLAFAATEIALPHYANDVAAADVNGDGWPDLIVAASDSGLGNEFHAGFVSVLIGTGSGRVAGPIDYPTAPGALEIVVGDFTRDGILDIATANASSIKVSDCGWPWKTWDSLSILPGNGNGTYAAASNFSIGNQLMVDEQWTNRNQVSSLGTADVNGDHATDLIVSDGTIFLNRPTDPNWPPTVTASSTQPAADHSITLTAVADDVDQDMLAYSWIDSGGTSIPPVPNPCFTPSTLGVHTFTVTVNDGHGHTASSAVTVDFGGGGGGGEDHTIHIFAPAAGEVVTGGQPYTIRWTAADAMAFEEVFVLLSTDGGATSTHIWECDYTQVSIGQCVWDNPGPASENAAITIVTRDADFPGSGGTGRFTIRYPASAPPYPWTHRDVGAVGAAGDATYASGVFTVSGSGADIWGTADEFHFVSQKFSSGTSSGTGDIDFVTHVDSVQNVNAWTKAGLMYRSGLGANALHASIFITPGKGVAFQRRVTFNGAGVNTGITGVTAPVWLRLSNRGNNVLAYYRKNASDRWTKLGEQMYPGPGYGWAYGGLAVTSHADGALATAKLSSVTFTPWPTWTATLIGSTVGSGTFQPFADQFTITNRGTDIWGTSDQFTFMQTTWDGDGQFFAHVKSVTDTNAWAKAGVMYRATLAADSPHVMVVVTPGKGVAMQYRTTKGGTSAMAGQVTGLTAPTTVRLDRTGNTFTGYWTPDGGGTWNKLGTATVAMPGEVFVGLPVTSHNASATATAVYQFANIHR